jgi:hypothetical protein
MPSRSWHTKRFNGSIPKDSHRIVNGNLWGLGKFKDHHDRSDGGSSRLWESIDVMEKFNGSIPKENHRSIISGNLWVC